MNKNTPSLCLNTNSSQVNQDILSIFWWILALVLNADKKATKSLKFNPSTILSSLWRNPQSQAMQHHIKFINFMWILEIRDILTALPSNFITWERGFIANSGTDKNSSAEMNPFAFRSSWQNLSYKDTISCWETAYMPKKKQITQYQIKEAQLNTKTRGNS